MSYVRFMNGNNPLWDFISEMSGEQQQHPHERRHRGGPPRGPWGWSPFDQDAERNPWAREMPHRPHHAHHGPHGRRGHHGPPPPPEYSEDARSTTLQADDTPINMVNNDTNDTNMNEKTPVPDPEISTPDDDEEGDAAAAQGESSGDERRFRGCHGRRGRHGPGHGPHGHGGPGFGRRGGFGGRGGMHGCRPDPRGSWGAGPWGHGHHGHRHPYGPPPHHRRWGSGPGPAHPLAPWANMFGIDMANFDPERLRETFAEALQTAASRVHPQADNTRESDNEGANNENSQRELFGFRPAADIYDASSEYIVHFALPGAKKEDISLNWDAEKSELNVAGVITREGDEDIIKTLALDERDVGCFERKVKLGREGVDAEGITAKMENGLLVVKVPKKVEDDWMEVRKVDIE